MAGPLTGLTIVELAGIGPGPMCSMMLGDMGADVIRVDRTKAHVMDRLADPKFAVHNRSRRSVSVDLQSKAGVEVVLRLIEKADGMTEPFRPGVAERLGLGPDVCLALNPKLVYGRMTGWGQDGPLARAAGHDLNYVALTGLLSLAARPGERPVLPPTVVGDAAGALGLAFGIVCALLDARRSGHGRVVDAAIVDVVAMLGTLVQWVRASGQIDGPLPSPFHDSPFYDVYTCADGGQVTIGALEPQFYALLLARLGLADVEPAAQYDRAAWPVLKARLTALFVSQPRAHWCALLEGSDVCFAPVLSIAEAAAHPHNAARGIYTAAAGGGLRVAPAPRFQRLPGVPG